MKEEKMCEGCIVCDPTSYTIEVDAWFLRITREALEKIRDRIPEAFAKGHLEICNDKIAEIEKKYNQKISPFN